MTMIVEVDYSLDEINVCTIITPLHWGYLRSLPCNDSRLPRMMIWFEKQRMVRMMMIATVIHENRVTAIISSKPQNAEDGDNAFTELTRWPSLKTDQFVSSFWSDKGVTTTTQKEVRHDHSVTYNISTWGKFSWWKQPLHSQIRNPISTMVPSEHLWSQGYYSSHTCACIISIGHALQVFSKWDFLFNWTLWRSDVSQMPLHHNLYRICMCPYTHLTMHSQTF